MASTVFYIQKGRVKVVVISEQGKEAVVGIWNPASSLEGCMNGHSLRIATTTAMEECLIAITKTAMLAALHEQPTFSELFMAICSRATSESSPIWSTSSSIQAKSASPDAPAPGQFRERGEPKPVIRKNQSGNACRNDRYDALPCELFHEQIPRLGLSVQWPLTCISSLLNVVLYDQPYIKRGP